MLGGFTIRYKAAVLGEPRKRQSKVWKLIQYLVAHRTKTISLIELIDLFASGEHHGNPATAIRTMIYRARAILAESGFPEDLLISGGGGYTWNNEYPCFVDTEEFEKLINSAQAAADENLRLDFLLRASELYKGDFLPQSVNEMWVHPLNRWYRIMFLNCAHDALLMLRERQMHSQTEMLASKALCVDPFDETLLEHLFHAMISDGKVAEAIGEYKKTEQLFFDTMGVELSDHLRSIFSDMQHLGEARDIPLDVVLKSWRSDDLQGAYYCDLIVFKTIYQIEARSLVRTGRTVFVVRIDTKFVPKNSKAENIMQRLAVVIPATLRKGDLYTRSAGNQYMLMLHNLTQKNCEALTNRILQSLDSRHISKISAMTIRPITPIE
jgi:DNA-binding SARP family transcriptional activator